MGKRLEGMSRNAGVHAAGVVIAPGPITDYAPLFKSNRDEITTQWAMKEVERVGLLKMDFLGLSTLTLIEDALAEIRRTDDVVLDLDAVPLDDPATYQLFCDGQTYGIFQFESSGMRELLRKSKPQRLDDLIALNALYRPGPAQERHGRRLRRPQAGQDRGQVRPRRARADPRRHLRGHRLPGTGDADRRGAGRLHARPVGRAAQGHGEEGPQGHGQAARGLPGRHQGQGDLREEGHQDLRADGVLRRLRLQQVALDGLRLPGLPDRLPQGQLPAALRRRAADHRGRQHRQAGALHRRVARARHRRAAARHQREPAAVQRRPRRRALRPDRDQGPGRGRHPGHPRGADPARPHHLAAPAGRGARPAHGQPARVRGAGQERRLRRAGPAARRGAGAAGASAGPGCCARSTPRSSTAPACSATASRARPTCSATAPRPEARPPPAPCPTRRLVGDGVAGLREGGARPLPERPPGGPARPGAAGAGRAHGRRPGPGRGPAGRGRRADPSGDRGRRRRRHRQRRPCAQDQEGRPDGGVHARGSPGRGRGRGLPRDLRPLPAPDRHRRAAAGARPSSSATTTRRASRPPSCRRSRRCASGWPRP